MDGPGQVRVWVRCLRGDYDIRTVGRCAERDSADGQKGLEVVPISSFVSKYEQKPALFLGFAGCNASEIKRGVSVLEAVLSR